MTLRILQSASAAGVMFLLCGCHTDMWIQPKDKNLQENAFFQNRMSARPQVPGTVPRGQADLDEAFFTGRVGGKLITEFPIEVSKETMKRGKERFTIFCSPCHGRLGDGKGMITQRGLILGRYPADYNTDRLRKIAIGHFFDVMTNGYGGMYSYASRIEPKDRWAIAAYIRALQLSQNATVADVPSKDLPALESKPQVPEDPQTR